MFLYLSLSVQVYSQVAYFFQESTQDTYYDSGLAFKTSPSSLEQSGPTGDKIPVTRTPTAFQGNHSLRIRWTSRPGGDWSALVIAPGFPFQDLRNLDTLAFWAYSPTTIPQDQLPDIFLEGAPGATKSRRYPLGNFTGAIPAATWVAVKIPLVALRNDPSQTGIQFSQIKAVILGQGPADGQEHTLLLDEVRAYRSAGAAGPGAPRQVRVRDGYARHVELRWQAPEQPQGITGYQIWRSWDGITFQPAFAVGPKDTIALDFPPLPDHADTLLRYQVRAVDVSGALSPEGEALPARLRPAADEDLLDMVQEYTFRYFWDFGHPASGMARERNTSGDVVTTGGTGFGIMGLLVGIERGFITREQGRERLEKILTFLESCDRFKGAFSHWLNGQTGKVVPFSTRDNGGDIVETAFLIQGLLTARSYFNADSPADNALRARITVIWEAVDWNWYRQQFLNVIYWHWSPSFQFTLNLPVRGYNETLMVYLLAVASPTHPVPGSLYQKGWAGGNYRNGNTYYGFPLAVGPARGGPLFFAHYSYLGFDPRQWRDDYTNYFEHNRNHTLVNRAYCIENPKGYVGYSADCWGLTASDDPLVGYLAHEPSADRDNGTISPTAALSSIVYTPTESLAALKYFYGVQGKDLWGPMGFYDAFNLSQNWFADSYLAIDQGPILVMIENYRSELLWKLFMANPEIEPALIKMDFRAEVTAVPTRIKADDLQVSLAPNPAPLGGQLRFTLPVAGTVSLTLFDAAGRPVQQLGKRSNLTAGEQLWELHWPPLIPGYYYLQIRTDRGIATLPVLIP